MPTRRAFMEQLGVAAALGTLRPAAALDRLAPRAAEISLGCAAITWGGDDERAIADIAALGYRGIQLRASAVARWRERPGALRDLLARHGLTFVALSSGNVPSDAPDERHVIDQHVAHARFVRDAGGLFVQLIDEPPRGRERVPADYERMGRLLTEVGRRTADLGIASAYHPHMGSLGERPDEIDRVLEASDPRYVRLLLDVAHYRAGGGDPAAAVRRYAGRLLFLHLKDVRMRPPGADGPPYQFVELGRGEVDLPAVVTALREVRFDGWAVVELDSVTEPGRTAREANGISKRYLETTLGLGAR